MLPSNAQLYLLDPADRSAALRRVASVSDGDEPRRAERTRLRAVIVTRRRGLR